MITYSYKAKKNDAQTVTGEITARSQEEAIELINQLGLLPVSVQAQNAEELKSIHLRKVKPKELYFFTRQLANLLKSGMPLLRALMIVEEQTANKIFRRMIGQISTDVKNGHSLSEALSKYPRVFSSLYTSVVAAGEESGSLYQMLVNISGYQKRQEEIINKVKAAVIYPVLMTVVGGMTVYFILTFVLPKMMALFKNIGSDLPLPTVILLKISGFLSAYWVVLAGILLFIVVGVKNWQRSASGRIALSRIILKIPLFGEMFLKTQMVRFAQTMVMLIDSGVSVLKSIEISIEVVDNEIIRRELQEYKKELERGGSFGESLLKSKYIPAMIGHLISVGEESGNLNEILLEMAESYEQDTNELIKLITTLLEPILILVVGLTIGFIVFAMLLPIFEFNVLSS